MFAFPVPPIFSNVDDATSSAVVKTTAVEALVLAYNAMVQAFPFPYAVEPVPVVEPPRGTPPYTVPPPGASVAVLPICCIVGDAGFGDHIVMVNAVEPVLPPT
jgi:hypothetical protein